MFFPAQTAGMEAERVDIMLASHTRMGVPLALMGVPLALSISGRYELVWDFAENKIPALGAVMTEIVARAVKQ